jgi:hypothetical protein
MARARWVVFLIVAGAPGIMLLPVWRLHGLCAGEDDLLYYFPSRLFFHESLAESRWPWINPWSGLGRPFAADPQSALWYPTTWLFALLPPLIAYPLGLWLHYALGAWGGYRLLRGLGLDRRAALFGGVAFAFCGFLLAHRVHFALQHAAAWMPWVFWRAGRYAARGGGRRLAGAAGVVALQALAGHVQIAALGALGTFVYILAGGGSRALAGEVDSPAPVVRGVALRRWLLAYLAAGALCAVQVLPTLIYLRECTRSDPSYMRFVENSWNPASLVGLVLPMLFGQQRTPNLFSQPYWGPTHQVEQFVYPGLGVLLLAAVALRGEWREFAERRAWVLVGAFALLLALGLYGPVCPLLYWLPGSSLFRVPARALLLVNLALAVLAATAVHDLGAAPSRARARLRAAALALTERPLRLVLLLVGVPLAAVLLVAPWLPHELRTAALASLRPWNPAVALPAGLLLVTAGAIGAAAGAWDRPGRLNWLLVVLLVDLGVIGWTLDVPRGVASVDEILNPPARSEWLAALREAREADEATPAAPFRPRLWTVTSRQGGTPGEYIDSVAKAAANSNIFARVPALTDYGPLHPRAWVAELGFAPWGETEKAVELLRAAGWMRLFDVGWVLVCDGGLPAPDGGELIARTGAGWRLYRVPHAGGTAMFEDASVPGIVQVVSDEPERVVLSVDTWPPRRGRTHERLLVSRLAAPGWRAKFSERDAALDWSVRVRRAGWGVDVSIGAVPSREIALGSAAGGLLAVEIPVGRPLRVEFRYFPAGLELGAVISLVTALGMCAAWWRG